MSRQSVSIIIPNYNGKHLLQSYLPHTLAVAQSAAIDFEIIVSDDCSADDSVSFLQQNYPEVKVVLSAENGGFSKACNKGISVARYELVLILNSDVMLLPGYFDSQLAYFNMPDTFGVMGRIIDMDGDGIQDAARMPSFNGFKLKTDYFYYSTEAAQCYTLYLSGANALINTAKLRETGGFDESLFSPFYGEDLELSLRAWRLNWKCYYEHNAVCRHMGQASTRNYKTTQWVKSIYYRNRFFVHALHLDGLSRVGWFLQITVVDLLPKLLAGQLWIWKSYTALLKSRSSISASRKRIKIMMQDKGSHTTLHQVVKFIKASIKGIGIVRFKA